MSDAPTTESTVAAIATDIPGAAGVFERFGIDYCCGGKLSLARACEKRGLDPVQILVAVHRQSPGHGEDARDWTRESMAELCDNIEQTHHAYLKSELPRVMQLAEKVARVHGERFEKLGALSAAFTTFAEDMFSHMAKEEKVLFPALRAMERGDRSIGGPIEGPIKCMTEEHDAAGAALAKFRLLTDDFAPTAHACNSWRVLLNDLSRLERDMHRHVHKENNILFPKGLAAADRVARDVANP